MSTGTREDPVWMRIIRDDDGPKWGNLIIMLGFTVLSGYLATRSQRLGAQIDLGTQARMRTALAGQRAGNALCRAGCRIQVAAARAYDRARPA